MELEVIGRQSSHYTRVVRIFAAELGVPIRLSPILDLLSDDKDLFAGNPALKLPILWTGRDHIYGSLNICRVLARDADSGLGIVWPEQADTPLAMNAHEILSHAMSAQVEIVLHEVVEQRPADTASRKRRKSLVNCLEWLDQHLVRIQDALPPRDLSYFEVSLYCLVAHIPFRNPMDLSGMPALLVFEKSFGARPSAQATPYRFDQ